MAYDYTLNALLVRPTKDLESATIIEAFDSIFTELKTKGFKPQLIITDNQAVAALKDYLATEHCEWQFVEPNNHRVNAAERAIQTFKNHFISGLCTTDSDFPLQLWDQLAEQAQDTLNLLRTSRQDPSKSAYEALNGAYNFNKWPMTPPGTKAVIWENPSGRQSWAPRGIDAWYVGPSKDHYRLYRFYCPETQAYRVNGSVDFFPQHCKLPTLNKTEHAKTVATELFECLPLLAQSKRQHLLKTIAKQLKAMATARAPTLQRVMADALPEPEQRVTPVTTSTVTTSTNPTAPRVMATTPRVHQRQTRNNTPRTTPAIMPPPTQEPRRSPRLRTPHVAPTATAYPINGYSVPNIITQEAVYHLAAPHNEQVWAPQQFLTSSPNTHQDN